MSNVKKAESKSLYTLISLEDYKSLLGIDDREDRLARFCIVTATFSIEQYCKRRFLRKKYFETVEFCGDLIIPLREYPVYKILAVFAMRNEKLEMSNGGIIEPEFYRLLPDCGTNTDIPFSIELSPAIARLGCKAIKVVYWAGYVCNEQLAMSKGRKMLCLPILWGLVWSWLRGI
jgi:hypothetical protein